MAGTGGKPRAGRAPRRERDRRPPGVPRPGSAQEGRGPPPRAAESRARDPRVAGADAALDTCAAGAGQGHGLGRVRTGPRPGQVRADSRRRSPPHTGSPPAAGRTPARSPPTSHLHSRRPGPGAGADGLAGGGAEQPLRPLPLLRAGASYRRPRRHPPAHARGQSGPGLRSGFYERRGGPQGGGRERGKERRREGREGTADTERKPPLLGRHTPQGACLCATF